MALKIISLVFVLLLGVVGGSTVPPVYIFGDSTADVGNNNFLPGNTAKANFPHNGIDFPHQKATGRFSNGFNGVDFIAKTMGHLRSPPPFLSFTNTTFHKHIFKGVNFASGGSGILDSTGSTLTMRMQLKYFSTVRSNISARVGEKAADEILSKSIFIVSTGGNDMFAFFAQFGPVNTMQREKFVATLISNYEDHIKTLYNLGARKFAIVGVPNVGCCPSIRSSNPTGNCINDLNAYASEFNEATKSLMHKLSSTYKGIKHAIGSTYEVVSNIMKNPHELGFVETARACCGSGKLNGASYCIPNATYCPNRHQYLFWDLFHPTQATSKLAAKTFYGGSPPFVTPITFKQLVED